MTEHNLNLRRFNPDEDIPRLVQLRVELEAHDQLGNSTTEEGLRAQFNWPDHDPAQDRYVLESPETGAFVGHGWTFSQSPERAIIEVAVHPDWRRHGLGSQLLQMMIERSNKKGVGQIVSGGRANNRVAHPFLLSRGFEPVGHNRFMDAPADVEIDEPVWPEGFTVRTYRELGDLAFLAEGSNRCYTDMWGHRENLVPASIERFEHHLKNTPGSYFPDGIFVIFDANNQLAGICFNRPEDNLNSIDSPGIVPEYRQLGLQRPLMQTSMRWLREQQADRDFKLWTWGDFDEAVQIYQGLGFTLTDDNHLIEYLLKEQ
ncbi:MAG: GNAT family N-acetyltransferase [Chloroflexota bacterium]